MLSITWAMIRNKLALSNTATLTPLKHFYPGGTMLEDGLSGMAKGGLLLFIPFHGPIQVWYLMDRTW